MAMNETDGFNTDFIGGAIAAYGISANQKLREMFLSAVTLNHKENVEICLLYLNKPYGTNLIIYQDNVGLISNARLLPGKGTSLHYHDERHELIYIKSGVATIRLGDHCRNYGHGSWIATSPSEPHSIYNSSNSFLELVELVVPGNLDDKTRLEDRYNRKLGKVIHTE